jgi:tRNA1(Val) A37 N6-methylase TrmN6
MKKTGPDVLTPTMEDETIDEILGGKLRIIQKQKGYRFSLDAFLLAHFIRLKKGEHIIDLGTGSGVIAIIMGARKGCGRAVGVDIQEDLVDMAKLHHDVFVEHVSRGTG